MTAAAAFNPNHLDDSAIVQALATGLHAPVLQAYFGAALHAELCGLAARALHTQPDKHAPLVYLLPGLLGSRLGVRNRRGTELLWLDPALVVSGRLTELAIGKRRGIKALGLMLPAYLKLQLSLQAAGFNVRCYAYDWRRSVVELGAQLADELLHESAREVMLVAHSMGGLVARAALKHAASAKVSRLIQLGTPNQGSYALVQVLRGVYPTVRKLGAVDNQHAAETLVARVFRSFYSFYEMLPASSAAAQFTHASDWPADALAPLAERFKYARRLPRYLASADQRCHAIVGVGQRTVCAVDMQHTDSITYHFNHAGDGTVPVSLAQWSGAQHWYVPEAHGQLPRNTLVCQSVCELLQHGHTRRLPTTSAVATDIEESISETSLRAALGGKVMWDRLPLEERRELLEPTISALFAQLCQAHGY